MVAADAEDIEVDEAECEEGRETTVVAGVVGEVADVELSGK